MNSLAQIAKEVIVSVLFGIALPSFDSQGDIRLSHLLYTNGHWKWALSVLTPVVVNTVFTIVSCKEMERKRWLLYLPLVVFQLYPQYCIARLIYRFLREEITLKQFKAVKNSMDGGIGCVESYCESVPQIFVQTAFFAFVVNMGPMLSRLCFQQISKPCNEYDKCDELYNCDMDPYVSGYKMAPYTQTYRLRLFVTKEASSLPVNIYRVQHRN